MPIINQNPTPDTSTNDSNVIALVPYQASDCAPNFSAQLAVQDQDNIDWLSIYPIVTQIVKHFIQLPQPLLLLNARYWQAATAVISACTEADYPQHALLNYDQETLFGRLNLQRDQSINFQQGEIFNYNNGCLTLHISPILANPALWFLIKAFLINNTLPATSAVNGDKLKGKYPQLTDNINTKIVLVANRYQLDELSQIDPEYTQVGSLFAELSSQIASTNENIQTLRHFCLQFIKENKLTPLSDDAYALLFHHLSSRCEHQKKLLFSPKLIEKILRYAQLFNQNADLLEKEDLQKVIDIQSQAQSLAQDFSDEALLEKQMKIQLSGKKVGQINGLSVVELMGYPTEFGEIFRVSASDMVGDGEVIDVERKVELAGNIHAKSTLIVQGYLNHLFTHFPNFPLSCNVVFEQSYQESDGDSAALAILLAVTSCYAQSPLQQNLFVTGALDQHGNVLAIGGVNQKIKSVSRLFSLGLLKEPITILMPKANQINLTLDEQTLALINDKKINIYGIDHCQEAFPLAMQLSFLQAITLINKRIEHLQKEDNDDEEQNMLAKLRSLFR
ncbi:MAG: S16 family serine protease [Psychromonas sp.]